MPGYRKDEHVMPGYHVLTSIEVYLEADKSPNLDENVRSHFAVPFLATRGPV